MTALPLFADDRRAAGLLLVNAEDAAKILGMPKKEFLGYVEDGIMPQPLFRGWWRRAHIMAIEKGKFIGLEYQDDIDRAVDKIEDMLIRRKLRILGRKPSPKLRAEVFERDGEVCQYCGDTEGPFVLDHIKPWSKGGKTTAKNLCVCCVSCNVEKGNMPESEWKEAINWDDLTP